MSFSGDWAPADTLKAASSKEKGEKNRMSITVNQLPRDGHDADGVRAKIGHLKPSIVAQQ